MHPSDGESYARKFTPDRWQIGLLLLKSVLRHPLLFLRSFRKHPDLEDHLAEYAPGVSFGRTDHPLDAHGPLSSAFTAIPNRIARRSKSILRVSLEQRTETRFLFRARAYDIFKLMKVEAFYRHVYEVDESTPWHDFALAIDFLRDDVYRLRLREGREVLDEPTPMIASDIRDPGCRVELDENDSHFRLSTSKLVLRISRSDFRIEVFDASGRRLTQTGGRTDNGFGIVYDAYPLGLLKDRKHDRWFATESFALAHGEAIYGLGEHFGPVNKVGQTLRLWITEGVGNTSGRAYKVAPFFVSTRGYGAFFHHTHPMTFWVGSKELSKTEVAVEADHLDYFFFAGDIKTVLASYTALTGRSAMPPRFSFGVWMSRMSYRSQEEVLGVARRLREERFPCDVIHIDDDWFQEAWRCDWQFDEARFPDPAQMCKELHELGFRVSLWQEPYVIRKTPLWNEACAKGYLAKAPVPIFFASKFEAAPIDFTNPDAARWYRERLLRPLLELGIDVIKTDFGEGVEPGMQFRAGDGHALHNVYPLLYNRSAYEIAKEVHGEDAMIWGRSAYAGSQRYPVYWSGDNGATFGSMRCSLRGGLDLGLSGFSFWSQDTGGFVGEPTDELYIRWTQLSVFQSHLRYHGCYSFREPWQFSEPAQRIVRRFLELRYRLIPYLYSESITCTEMGLPLLRHLVVDHPADPTVYGIDDQFLCGSQILVAPILSEEGERVIYLPPGEWVDFFSFEYLDGGRWIRRECALEEIPVFVRAGSIFPLGPVVQSTAELADDPALEVRIFFDRDGHAAYRYRDGQRSVRITASRSAEGLEVRTSEPLPITATTAFDRSGAIEI